ncbi:MAG: exo-alpha-sialidase [Candidatus Accumulibacter sp.]|nr:exo-alpha-sialidase [Accumulibacter sp.]
MKPGIVRVPGVAVILAVTLWAAWPGLYPPPAPGFVPPPVSVPAALGEAPRLFSTLISGTHSRNVHAASLAERSDGRLFAVWFGGTDEGSADVRIYGAEGVPAAGGHTLWDEPKAVVSREETEKSQKRWVRKLGNPVVFADSRRSLWLAHVSATMGGWASSRLNLLRLSETPPASRRLVTSPFFNMSTLAKGPPVLFDNGDIGLPVYHELAGKFAELLVLTPEGEARRKIRMDHGQRTLQPVLLVEDAQRAIALMRDASDDSLRVWRSETADAGRSWSEPRPTDLHNPNSALAALRLDDGRLLAVANDTEDQRLRLSLLVSEDRGHRWRVVHRFEDRQARYAEAMPKAAFRALLSADLAALAPARTAAADIVAAVIGNLCERDRCQWQYDYPYLIRAGDGDFHLVYTWNRSFIRYVRFNAAWLRERLGESLGESLGKSLGEAA